VAPDDDKDLDEREDSAGGEDESEKPEAAADSDDVDDVDHDEEERDAEDEGDEAPTVHADASAPRRESDDPAIIANLKLVDRGVGAIELGALVGLVLLLILIGSYNAVRDLAGMRTSLSLAELFRYSVFAIAMTGAALAAQRSSMISMDIVGRMVRPTWRIKVRILTNSFAAFMTYLLLTRAHDVTKAVRDDVPYDNIPPSKGVWILPIGAALIVFHLAVHAIIDIMYLAYKKLPPESEDIQVH
jgi:TRAP-type C4-dicarboxylate transport system permease small subunit